MVCPPLLVCPLLPSLAPFVRPPPSPSCLYSVHKNQPLVKLRNLWRPEEQLASFGGVRGQRRGERQACACCLGVNKPPPVLLISSSAKLQLGRGRGGRGGSHLQRQRMKPEKERRRVLFARTLSVRPASSVVRRAGERFTTSAPRALLEDQSRLAGPELGRNQYSTQKRAWRKAALK